MSSAPLFWIIALALVAATVAALVWPLLRSRAPRIAESEDVATTDIYRDQKRQLDAELAAGAITRAERAAGLDELAARLANELAAPVAAPRPSTRSSYVTALAVAAALPVTALVLYVAFGNPDAMRATPSTDARAPMSHEQIAAMVENLAARMKERPEDPTGWRLLARAYSAMGRYEDSVAAFMQAATRAPEDAGLLADWADALAMKNQSLQGEPSRLVARALTLDPNHSKALALAASAALERNDYDTAIAQWRKLQGQFPADSDAAKEIGTMMAEADAAKRGVRSTAPPAQPDASAPSDAAAITGNVSLDPRLREKTAAGDTLFIYARAATGPRMPLAIVRTTAAEWPREFRLDDSMAMAPASRLSNAEQVVVEARISKSGNATPSPGDLRGSSAAVKPGTRNVSVVIDDIVR